MRPDILSLHTIGAGQALIEIMEKLKNTEVELILTRAQYAYIYKNMIHTKDGWVRKDA